MTSPLPVPGIAWQAPYQGQAIHRDHHAEARHGNESHWYRVTDSPNPFPSVTTILGIIDKSQALLNWHQRSTLNKLRQDLLNYLNKEARPGLPQNAPAVIEQLIAQAAQEPDRIKNYAADLGTTIHKAIEQVLLGQPHHIQPPNCQAGIAAALAFLEDGELRPLAAETNAWHPTHGYAGQIDCIARHEDGTLAVIDWKSGSRLYPAYRIQAAAYAVALEELTGQPVNHAFIVKVPKQPLPSGLPYESDEVPDIAEEFLTFQDALSLWNRLHR